MSQLSGCQVVEIEFLQRCVQSQILTRRARRFFAIGQIQKDLLQRGLRHRVGLDVEFLFEILDEIEQIGDRLLL